MQSLLSNSGIPFDQYPELYGKPDFLIRPNIAIFCDGSLWHGRNWSTLRKKLLRGNNADYWVKHISRNRARDRRINARLKQQGYKVVRLWDKDVYKRPEWCLSKIRRTIESG